MAFISCPTVLLVVLLMVFHLDNGNKISMGQIQFTSTSHNNMQRASIVFFFVNNPLNTVLLAQLHKNLVQIVSHEALRPQIKKILDDLTCWWPCVCVAAGVQAQPPPPVAMTSRRSCSRETGSRRETTSPILRQPPATSPSPVLPPDAQTQYSNINLLIKNKNY